MAIISGGDIWIMREDDMIVMELPNDQFISFTADQALALLKLLHLQLRDAFRWRIENT